MCGTWYYNFCYLAVLLFTAIVLDSDSICCFAWSIGRIPTAPTTRLFQQHDDDDQNDGKVLLSPLEIEGTERIHQAVNLVCEGKDPESLVQIEWKTERQKVTVTVVADHNQSTYISTPAPLPRELSTEADEEKALIFEIDEEESEYDESELVAADGTTSFEDTTGNGAEDEATGLDIAVLARAINVALEGLEPIASTFTVEVTTPGILSNNRSELPLTGDVMFQAYRGFTVVARYSPPDKKKVQRIEGKLVEKNDLFTLVNVKGRIRKLKNEHVVEVCLPPAKKEK